MKRVYVAGKLNGMACDYNKNLHYMIVWAEKVRRAGYAVFVPGLDMLIGVVMGDLDYADYFDNSQPWLDASDAVFLTPGWETSEGTKREIERAKAQNIPFYSDLDLLVKELGDLK